MRRKYCYGERTRAPLVDFLEKNRICYELTEDILSFSIWDDSENAAEIINKLAEIVVREPIVLVEYSEKEISSAELIWITPKKQNIDIINGKEAYLSTCKYTDFIGMTRTKHMQQIGLFAVAKEPSMKKRTAFWAESTGFSVLFADFRVRNLVKDNALSGVVFNNVLLKNRSYSEKLFQMTSDNVLGRQCIGTGYGEKIISCRFCGKEQFVIETSYQLHMDFSKIGKKSDMYVTEQIFGDGIASPLYIISQQFYQLLKKANLAGGITVSPVVDIGDRA